MQNSFSMGNPESPRNLIRKEIIEKTERRDENYVREKLNRLGISADNENIDALTKLISFGSLTVSTLKEAIDNKNSGLILKKIERYKKWHKIGIDEGLTDEEATVAVKFLDGIKERFRPGARGEKPRDYVESIKDILRSYNITLTLDDMDSLDNFSIKNKEPQGLKARIAGLAYRGITPTDKLVEKLSEIYGEDEDWKKYLVQKNIQKREISECLKIYVKYPKKFVLRHYTIGKRIIERALYRELVAMDLDKKVGAKEKKGEKPAKLSITDKVSYEIIKGLKKKDLGE